MPREGALVEVEGVVKRFGSIEALRGVSLRVEKGEVVGLLGPNASGKTTLLKLVMGFMRPDEGSVRVLGRDPYEEPAVRARVGYVPEEVLLYDSLTVREFLYFLGRMRRMDPSTYMDRVRILTTVFEMEDKLDCLIGSLSRGDKQRLAVIGALMHEPEVLVLDEPIMGLDPVAARVFKEITLELKGRGRGILMSTHVLELAEALCDRIYVLHEGRVVAEGDVKSIRGLLGEDKSLEEVFLRLTEKDEVVEKLIAVLREEF